ncbi:MAG: hypothetical protein A2132_05700 [Nitrospirae bacterium RBG_16_43_11]|nr:MAG: hypothetical protein A2132_05700 [Nitrospirae bacterium RBG_16_43_11]
MKKILILKRYLIPSVIISAVFVIYILLYPDKNTRSQVPPSPPPVPVPLTPSVLEDIRNTKHNLSSIGPSDRAVFTQQTTEICIFCHTPHGAVGDEEAAGLKAPLWNRRLSTARYILYDQVWSTSFEGFEVNPPKPNAPTGYSRLCLSCHDGTIALGTVVNPPGSGISYQSMDMIYPTGHPPAGGAGTIPVGAGVATGDTRVIGTNLQNDHPVSFIYDSSLAMRDEELVDPGPALIAPSGVGDTTPLSPMRRYPGGDPGKSDSVQCTSCHNPHAATYPKFLRASSFNNDPADPNYPSASKILCLYCHDKPGWNGSSHDTAVFVPPANPTSANAYNFDGTHTVRQYACRACHDPHTTQGAKRLLREGVDVNNQAAIENTCYLCHRPPSEMGNPPNAPPNIRSEFYKDKNLGRGGTGSAMNVTMGQGHEPVFVSRPQEGIELNSHTPPPFNEYPPGSTIKDTVHVECVDCHNPHQVTRTNRLKGMNGIDINGNVVGAKIPGNSREPYVHEVCLRCHGDSYTNLFFGDRYPDDTDRRSSLYSGMTTSPDFSMKGYSNKRKEFNPETPDIGQGHTQQIRNASFHPVAAPGRNGTAALCQQLAVAFNLKDSDSNPSGIVGDCDNNPAATLQKITITCTDCHNNSAFGPTVKGPLTGQPDGTSFRRATDFPPNSLYFTEVINDDPTLPQGPHGSGQPRILRSRYNTNIDDPARSLYGPGFNASFYNNFYLCFQCHDRRAFDPFVGNESTAYGEIKWTNFMGVKTDTPAGSWTGNLHKFHLKAGSAYCHECHNNVHSNVEATNTIYGNGAGGELPDDAEDGIVDGVVSTHLVNFAPKLVSGSWGEKAKWFLDTVSFPGRPVMRCYLSCHGIDMNSCFYAAPVELLNFQCVEGC